MNLSEIYGPRLWWGAAHTFSTTVLQNSILFSCQMRGFCYDVDMAKTYTVKNKDKGTNWNVGARIKRISDWSGGKSPAALFTDAFNPGACIWAHLSEVG
jgi:hypothetical protein